MHLVTVTWHSDLKPIMLQAESLDKFMITPVTHYLIINNHTVNLSRWNNILKPYYKRHTLKLLPAPQNYIVKGSSYVNQQTLKLWAGTLINDDYMVLDSKNFFIRETRIEEYNNRCTWSIWPVKEQGYHTGFLDYEPFVDLLCNDFSLKKLSIIPGIGTPYILRKAIVDRVGGYQRLTDWFFDQLKNKNNINISEFMLYGHLLSTDEIIDMHKINEEKIWHFTCWNHDRTPFHKLQQAIARNPSIKTLGIHWRWLKDKRTDIDQVNAWIRIFGLKNKLKQAHAEA